MEKQAFWASMRIQFVWQGDVEITGGFCKDFPGVKYHKNWSYFENSAVIIFPCGWWGMPVKLHAAQEKFSFSLPSSKQMKQSLWTGYSFLVLLRYLWWTEPSLRAKLVLELPEGLSILKLICSSQLRMAKSLWDGQSNCSLPVKSPLVHLSLSGKTIHRSGRMDLADKSFIAHWPLSCGEGSGNERCQLFRASVVVLQWMVSCTMLHHKSILTRNLLPQS